MQAQIAEATGFVAGSALNSTCSFVNRIHSKIVAADVDRGDDIFLEVVRLAYQSVQAESTMAMDHIVTALCRSEAPAQNGQPLQKARDTAANGVRYSFGPVWNASVASGRGAAILPANRTKLNFQGSVLGISDAENMTVAALCSAISAKL